MGFAPLGLPKNAVRAVGVPDPRHCVNEKTPQLPGLHARSLQEVAPRGLVSTFVAWRGACDISPQAAFARLLKLLG